MPMAKIKVKTFTRLQDKNVNGATRSVDVALHRCYHAPVQWHHYAKWRGWNTQCDNYSLLVCVMCELRHHPPHSGWRG